MISEYLSTLKESRGYSNQRIAEKSGVSLSTVERILSGKAKSTSFEVLRDITFALEGNMDDLVRAAESTSDAHPETWGKGPDVPAVPDRARDLATAADLNRIVSIYTDALHERDEIYREHTQTRTDAYNRGLAALRTEHVENIRMVEAAHKTELADLKEAHKEEIRSVTAAHKEEIRSVTAAHKEEIRSVTAAHVREVRSKDRWITILALLCILCVVAMIIMMIAAIRNPAVNLFGT